MHLLKIRVLKNQQEKKALQKKHLLLNLLKTQMSLKIKLLNHQAQKILTLAKFTPTTELAMSLS